MTLFGLTGRLCCIARALLIHETITLSLSLPEVINMSVTWKRIPSGGKVCTTNPLYHLSYTVYLFAMINQFPRDRCALHGFPP